MDTPIIKSCSSLGVRVDEDRTFRAAPKPQTVISNLFRTLCCASPDFTRLMFTVPSVNAQIEHAQIP